MSGEPLKDAIEHVIDLIRQVESDPWRMPATFLFNEGWMLRLILRAAQFDQIGELIPKIDSTWASEVKLYTPFTTTRGFATEGLTNADGVIGNFSWKPGTTRGLVLNPDLRRFEVFEAKMASPFSKGVKGAPWYNQAARTLACMAHTLALRQCSPGIPSQARIGFWLVAPKCRIEAGIFSREMKPDVVRANVLRRIEQFSGQGRQELSLWYDDYFDPLLEYLTSSSTFDCISWEDLIEQIRDSSTRLAINQFYNRCQSEAGLDNSKVVGKQPVRGRRYRILGEWPDQEVVVCFADRKKSRVFIPGSKSNSWLVENCKLLQSDNCDLVELPTPANGEERKYEGKRVRVVFRGPCRSRIVPVNAVGSEELVDNHLLLPIPG